MTPLTYALLVAASGVAVLLGAGLVGLVLLRLIGAV
jgi:hypothetical protein